MPDSKYNDFEFCKIVGKKRFFYQVYITFECALLQLTDDPESGALSLQHRVVCQVYGSLCHELSRWQGHRWYFFKLENQSYIHCADQNIVEIRHQQRTWIIIKNITIIIIITIVIFFLSLLLLECFVFRAQSSL